MFEDLWLDCRFARWTVVNIPFHSRLLHMSSETPRPAPEVSMSTLAAAAERRACDAAPQKSSAQVAAEYERRQKFRRMIDPGIIRPNAEAQAHRSLKVVSLHRATMSIILGHPTDAVNDCREPDSWAQQWEVSEDQAYELHCQKRSHGAQGYRRIFERGQFILPSEAFLLITRNADGFSPTGKSVQPNCLSSSRH